MAKPDQPNFTIVQRIAFGVISVSMIVMLLHFLGYIPAP